MPAAYALSPYSISVSFQFLFSRHSNSKVFVFRLKSMVIGNQEAYVHDLVISPRYTLLNCVVLKVDGNEKRGGPRMT
jgi:hypothetical protein